MEELAKCQQKLHKPSQTNHVWGSGCTIPLQKGSTQQYEKPFQTFIGDVFFSGFATFVEKNATDKSNNIQTLGLHPVIFFHSSPQGGHTAKSNDPRCDSTIHPKIKHGETMTSPKSAISPVAGKLIDRT